MTIPKPGKKQKQQWKINQQKTKKNEQEQNWEQSKTGQKTKP